MENYNQYTEDTFELEGLQERARLTKLRKARGRRYRKYVRWLWALIVVLCAAMAFFAYLAVDYYAKAQKSAVIHEEAREIAAAVSEPPPNYRTEPLAPEFTGDAGGEPGIEAAKMVLEKVTNLREAFSNDGIVGYVKIDGTNIDYAVAQSSDNEFYLKHDLRGERNDAGSIFMDYECNANELGRHTVIYGHNMRNGTMFHNIRYYSDREYYDGHRYILLTTPYEETVWEIFAFYKTGTDFYYIQVVFPDDRSFESLVNEMKEKSIYDTGVEVGGNDKILTLSTCVGTPDDTRYVLNAKLIAEQP